MEDLHGNHPECMIAAFKGPKRLVMLLDTDIVYA
jgi:hypothetical protein